MVKKVGGGWKVYSESGKSLSKTLPTKKDANQRLRQVEYFKRKK